MSLIGTIQQSASALQVAQVGLQVVGNNIANANTPGFIRQQLEQSSSVAVREGNLIKGTGVRPTAITQVVDRALAERMFSARTDLSGAEDLAKAYSQLEELTTDLNNEGLSQQLTLFNNSLHELSAQPGDLSLRDFVILQGETLAGNIRRSREEALSRRELWNGELENMSDEINRLTQRIARLNLDIATIEGGGLVHSDASGLRDQRYQDLEELSQYVKLNIQEQESGAVAVFVGGDYLISDGNSRDVYTAYNSENGGSEIRIIETDSALTPTGGKVASALEARDGVFGEFVDNLDSMAQALIRSVNEVHSQGQGRRGHRELTAHQKTDPGVPLDVAGLAWEPRNGTFDINLVDDSGQVISNHRIGVRLLGQVGDSTVHSIATDIDAIDGLTATVTSQGRLQINSDSSASSFTFGEDTSGFLAAAGVNTFFVGKHAGDIDVSDRLKENSDLLAISADGVGNDTDVLTQMIDLVDRPLDNLDGRSVRQIYQNSAASTGQKISLQRSSTEGLRNFYQTLQSQHMAITGVNIDEESIKMITHQRAFQASSRVISTAAEMLDLLVQL